MPRPLPTHLLDDAIERYLAGEPFDEIQSATGVSSTSFHRERTSRGIPPRRVILNPSPAVLATEYAAGESEYALGKKYDLSRSTVRARLLQQGVQIRNQSEAGLLRASKMSAAERTAQTAAAHEAVRGTSPDESTLIQAAKTRMERGTFGSTAEQSLWGHLNDTGTFFQPQMAIGRYNVDLAARPVAVEVFGGGWHLRRKGHHAERTKNILDAGWHLVIVWDLSESRLRSEAADYVVAFLEEARRNPAAVREYRVITGDGQLLSAGRADRYEFTLEPPPRGRVKPWA